MDKPANYLGYRCLQLLDCEKGMHVHPPHIEERSNSIHALCRFVTYDGVGKGRTAGAMRQYTGDRIQATECANGPVIDRASD